MESMRYKEERVQQRSARQAFRNHVSEVHKYLNSVTENRILPQKKRAYLDQCTEELMWKSDDQTSESTEFKKRHKNFNNTIGTVFDKLRQEDKNAQQELGGLYKDVKSMIDSTGSDELVDKDKLQSECSDIIDWILKHPNAYKADYENQQNKLETIRNQYQDQLQQRNKDLQSDFFNYLKQIKHYVEDKSYSELVHSDEKATLLREYSIGYLWIENQKKVKYSELVEKKKNLVHVCQPIFDRLMRAEFNRTKKTLEDYVHQVEQKVRFEYSTRLNENDKRVIQGKCENVRQFRKKNKNANTEELKTVYFDLTSAVEPILKKLRKTYENNESKRQRHPSTTNTKVITQQPRNEQSTPENDNRQYSEGYGYQDVKKKTTRLISPDQTFSKPERDRDSSRLAIAGNRVRCFPVSDKHKYGAHTQSQKTSRGDEYHYFPSNSQMQSQGEFQTLDETSRPYSGRLHSSSSKSGKNTPIAEAKANLSVYVKEIINDLDNDASRGFFLSTNHRNQLYGSCAEVRNWLKETKNPSLEEIERKTQQLKTKCQASGLRSNRLIQSDWL
uniref:uncharacterized protein LOC120343434 n=1 Tax=Styela clava TaxID=7725 RepID=UPI00193A806D|nr:uncharacterized protein LOC120343434 [Styela clava]XP_039268542.1 uncharacterized protein LOC120343434 [Styela clava]